MSIECAGLRAGDIAIADERFMGPDDERYVLATLPAAERFDPAAARERR